MGRAREAIDAAVLAAPVGVDRAVEADIGRIIAGNDRPALVEGHGGIEAWLRFVVLQSAPAVVDGVAAQAFEPPGTVGERAPADPGTVRQRHVGNAGFRSFGGVRVLVFHSSNMESQTEQNKNFCV